MPSYPINRRPTKRRDEELIEPHESAMGSRVRDLEEVVRVHIQRTQLATITVEHCPVVREADRAVVEHHVVVGAERQHIGIDVGPISAAAERHEVGALTVGPGKGFDSDVADLATVVVELLDSCRDSGVSHDSIVG